MDSNGKTTKTQNKSHLLGIADGILHDGYAELHHIAREHLVRLLLLRYRAPVVVDERAVAALIVLKTNKHRVTKGMGTLLGAEATRL